MSSTNPRQERQQTDFSRRKRDAIVAAAAGSGAALFMALGAFVVGRAGGSEARALVEAMIPTTRFLCSAVMTAAATILALMLTMLGTSVKAQAELDPAFYHRIRQIAFYDMLVLIGAACFLVLQCIPLTKSDELADWWYPAVYYALLGASAMLGGAMISVVAMLYAALRVAIEVIGLEKDNHPLVQNSKRSASRE